MVCHYLNKQVQLFCILIWGDYIKVIFKILANRLFESKNVNCASLKYATPFYCS